MNHRDLFPFADPADAKIRAEMEEAAKMIEEDLAGGGYLKKKAEASDRKQLKKIRQWLALPVEVRNS